MENEIEVSSPSDKTVIVCAVLKTVLWMTFWVVYFDGSRKSDNRIAAATSAKNSEESAKRAEAAAERVENSNIKKGWFGKTA